MRMYDRQITFDLDVMKLPGFPSSDDLAHCGVPVVNITQYELPSKQNKDYEWERFCET